MIGNSRLLQPIFRAVQFLLLRMSYQYEAQRIILECKEEKRPVKLIQ